MGKVKTERRRKRALATPLELSRMDGRKGRPELEGQLKTERLNGANVPARVVERMGGASIKGVRVSEGDSGPRLRPTRKPRTAGSEAYAAGLSGGAYGSSGDGIKRLTSAEIRANRDRYFKDAERSRNEHAAEIVSRPVPTGEDVIGRARADYRYAVGQANRRREADDASGAEAWMREARKYRRMFRNK